MESIFDYAIEGYKDIKCESVIGIFGDPIKHTKSPVIHNTLSDILDKDERYIPFHIKDDLKRYVNMAYAEGILGLNITVPHKQKVMEALVDIDKAAKDIGAVNTLVRVEGGYKGYNTDMPGLARAMLSEGMSIQDKNVIILGAGGAARAVAYMCNYYKAKKVYIINRTFDNAKKITDDMNECFDTAVNYPVSADDYNKIPRDEYIFIQSTSIGLHEEDGLPLVADKSFYDMASSGVDLIYNPAETAFLRILKEKNIPCMNGLKMLLYQGIMAYELWNNLSVSEDVSEIIYKALYQSVYSDCNNIILVGYMGSGKSTIGKYLSKEYGYDFIDTDEYIEAKQGISINEIFATYGEEYFRNLETEVLRELKDKCVNTVVSTGGGMPVRKDNHELLRDIGKVIYLSAEPESIYERVKDSTNRPLLMCENLRKKIEDMLAIRNPIYNEVANYVVRTDNKKVDEIVSEILTLC